MLILGIETSCDETAAAVVEDGCRVVSSVLYSQDLIHGPYGGVVPELACRRHSEVIAGVVEEAMARASVGWSRIEAVAVTGGPGLIGALLVGGAYAKATAWAHRLPLISVHHLEGHIFSAFLNCDPMRFPMVALIVSGGHTNLYYCPSFLEYRVLGWTLDDSAGEAFDKAAKMLGLGYPGGPAIDRLSREAQYPAVFPLPYPESYNFSFSGLKTALLYHLQDKTGEQSRHPADIAAGYQRSIVEVLATKAIRAASEHRAKDLVVGGGVAANSLLRRELQMQADEEGITLHLPEPAYCTDNAAMIAAAAHPHYQRGERAGLAFSPSSDLMLGSPLH
jgi:N6-L-threonylcarbamoyladenine synthase